MAPGSRGCSPARGCCSCSEQPRQHHVAVLPCLRRPQRPGNGIAVGSSRRDYDRRRRRGSPHGDSGNRSVFIQALDFWQADRSTGTPTATAGAAGPPHRMDRAAGIGGDRRWGATVFMSSSARPLAPAVASAPTTAAVRHGRGSRPPVPTTIGPAT